MKGMNETEKQEKGGGKKKQLGKIKEMKEKEVEEKKKGQE